MRISRTKPTNTLTDNIVKKLEQIGVEDFEISDVVSRDNISVNMDLNNTVVYIPEENYEYSQYEIDDFIRDLVPYIRTNVTYDSSNGIFIMKLTRKLTEFQLFKLVKYIATEDDLCVLINK